MTSSIENLVSAEFVADLPSLSMDEVRSRRGQCQDAEEVLSLQRRLVQGRLDIVQAELYRRAGGGSETDVANLVENLPQILVERGDRHLGPGRLTALTGEGGGQAWDDELEAFSTELDGLIDGASLSNLTTKSDEELRQIADNLDAKERTISQRRHRLHGHIDRFQEEVVRRYKSGDASVDSLLKG